MARNFFTYGPDDLRKINAMRRANSQPHVESTPVLGKEKLLFVTATEMHDEPASCYNCVFYNHAATCGLIGPHVAIKKFIFPKKETSDSKPIEYWPCCGMHQFGQPNYGPPSYTAKNDPSSLDLLWINAPAPGLPSGGANCGGATGGDDCDHYCTPGGDKRAYASAFCRVLQCTVNGGDVCTAWDDDDKLSWQKAQAILNDK